MRKSKAEKLFTIVNYAILIVLSFSILFPFWRIVMLSLNEGIDSMRGGIYFWPRVFTLDNYSVIFARSEIMNAYKVTIFRTVVGTILSVFLMSLMAYGLSKRHLRGRQLVNVLVLFTMFFSGGLIPFYLLLKDLHLLNSVWVYIVPSLYSAWNLILFRTFFQQLPAALEESAKIDGASDLIVYFRIVVPLSMPIFATISLFVAVGHWNDWFSGTVYVRDPNLVPLQTLLMSIIRENDSTKMIAGGVADLSSEGVRTVTSYSVKMATLIATILPVIMLYPFLQKYFVKGVMVGSIKG
ncbi:carbohydrate ABC transporter permease [Paenibacillus mendelii]|uniref:Carbohydrate ABC transporter permease n=1 Tax=Paenibacillus mendelii TaxID=206163 RepID=A0ABV6JLA3_9BACL|nr:carbohydrate ABC transporter permease [Paenibacillus mendelii]MCQ6562283.1 carbohydrate ABC transporter permease [Paenibacillus mendelii]